MKKKKYIKPETNSVAIQVWGTERNVYESVG